MQANELERHDNHETTEVRQEHVSWTDGCVEGKACSPGGEEASFSFSTAQPEATLQINHVMRRAATCSSTSESQPANSTAPASQPP